VSEAFPRNFIFGAATSAYQIEGAVTADGRGPSIWDTFAARQGTIIDGSDGRVACDHYRLWREDVDLMRWLGLGAYRFSVAWPRILPSGRGAVNQPGLDFYERLVDALLEWHIEPYLTLYHWDLPQALSDQGGWCARDTAHAFVEYADVVSRRLGDRVGHWITHNEPWCTAMHGYVHGEHAPGERDWLKGLQAAHHVLLSHGLAVPVIRANAKRSEVGITLNLTYCEAASAAPADVDACRAKDGTYNRWYLDPVFGRGYPADVVADHIARGTLADERLPFVQEGDLAAIAVRTDMLGVNYYTRDRIVAGPNGQPASAPPLDEVTDIGWEVHAAGLSNLLLRLHREYQPARMYITENGAAYHTAPAQDGRVHDVARQRYLHAHLDAVHEACRKGAPIAGYFVWSLLDNYEWAYGYTQRFGIVWVDYETQQRIPKDSAHWYRELIRAHALPPVPSISETEDEPQRTRS
jgi:beta-glucosidase